MKSSQQTTECQSPLFTDAAESDMDIQHSLFTDTETDFDKNAKDDSSFGEDDEGETSNKQPSLFTDPETDFDKEDDDASHDGNDFFSLDISEM